MIHGILNVDKPAGASSARVVSHVKRLLPRGTKIGHAGTLDPFATVGCCCWSGGRRSSGERLMDEPKQYEATANSARPRRPTTRIP
jgi:tRNA pseudouridine55 synthase